MSKKKKLPSHAKLGVFRLGQPNSALKSKRVNILNPKRSKLCKHQKSDLNISSLVYIYIYHYIYISLYIHECGDLTMSSAPSPQVIIFLKVASGDTSLPPGRWLATAEPLSRAQSAKNLGCSFRARRNGGVIAGKIIGNHRENR